MDQFMLKSRAIRRLRGHIHNTTYSCVVILHESLALPKKQIGNKLHEARLALEFDHVFGVNTVDLTDYPLIKFHNFLNPRISQESFFRTTLYLIIYTPSDLVNTVKDFFCFALFRKPEAESSAIDE